MNIEYGELYKNSVKKLKKHHNESNLLEKILVHIKTINCFEDLKNNPMSIAYGYEPLKYQLAGYHSFNLCKKGGVIRLIFSIQNNLNTVILEFVSMNHYDDFKNRIKK